MTLRPLTLTVAATAALALTAPARADEAPAPAPAGRPLAVDVELDPIAYALDGYSLHAGFTRAHLRLDLGAFALRLPDAIHGQDGFDARFDGYGAKLQYFLRGDGAGGFVGVGAGVGRVLVTHDATGTATRTTSLSTGVHVGWRITLPADFYATPWIGVDYAWTGADDVMLGGDTFTRSRWSVFPTIHLGRRFR